MSLFYVLIFVQPKEITVFLLSTTVSPPPVHGGRPATMQHQCYYAAVYNIILFLEYVYDYSITLPQTKVFTFKMFI